MSVFIASMPSAGLTLRPPLSKVIPCRRAPRVACDQQPVGARSRVGPVAAASPSPHRPPAARRSPPPARSRSVQTLTASPWRRPRVRAWHHPRRVLDVARRDPELAGQQCRSGSRDGRRDHGPASVSDGSATMVTCRAATVGLVGPSPVHFGEVQAPSTAPSTSAARASTSETSVASMTTSSPPRVARPISAPAARRSSGAPDPRPTRWTMRAAYRARRQGQGGAFAGLC